MVVLPGGLEISADRRPLVIDTAEYFPADFTNKSGATGRLSLGPVHGNTKIVNLGRQFPRNPTGGEFIGLRPVKRRTKQCTAGTAVQTWIVSHT